MGNEREAYTTRLVIKAAMEALRGKKSLKKIAKEFKVQAREIIVWKEKLLEEFQIEIIRREKRKETGVIEKKKTGLIKSFTKSITKKGLRIVSSIRETSLDSFSSLAYRNTKTPWSTWPG